MAIDRIVLIPAAMRGDPEADGVHAFADAVAYVIKQAGSQYRTTVEASLARDVRAGGRGSRLRYSIPPFAWRTKRTGQDLDVFLTPAANSMRAECVAFGERTSNAYRVFETGSLDLAETAHEIVRIADSLQMAGNEGEQPLESNLTAGSLDVSVLQTVEAVLGISPREFASMVDAFIERPDVIVRSGPRPGMFTLLGEREVDSEGTTRAERVMIMTTESNQVLAVEVENKNARECAQTIAALIDEMLDGSHPAQRISRQQSRRFHSRTRLASNSLNGSMKTTPQLSGASSNRYEQPLRVCCNLSD